ncbi:hypothetical protein [Coleofasciculus sp. F4-SAH-05]|uniref:hypothetical protein n=1 Tax=Coleofasciculus sp. F4-SAH-05 TaxID=3069525 RepID=UPI0032FFEB97
MGLRKLMGLGLVMLLLPACSIFYEDEAAITPEETVDETAIDNASTLGKEELEKDYDLTWDLDVEQTIEAEYKNKPIILAESVELLAVD